MRSTGLHFIITQLSVGNALQNTAFYAMLLFMLRAITLQLKIRQLKRVKN
jgi:hypothetical protein